MIRSHRVDNIVLILMLLMKPPFYVKFLFASVPEFQSYSIVSQLLLKLNSTIVYIDSSVKICCLTRLSTYTELANMLEYK